MQRPQCNSVFKNARRESINLEFYNWSNFSLSIMATEQISRNENLGDSVFMSPSQAIYWDMNFIQPRDDWANLRGKIMMSRDGGEKEREIEKERD